VVQEEEFASQLALDVWLELNGDFVSVVEFEYPSADLWAYNVSSRLSLPKIKVKYINFFPDEV
jgi:hypothetical protein